MSNDNFYHPELDGLRFAAFLLVFFHHAPALFDQPFFILLSQKGWVGVDLFLFLSAFLFARLLHLEHATTGGIRIKNFYIRRALRIWPLYFVFLGGVFCIKFLRYGWYQYATLRALGMIFFVDNLLSAVFDYNLFLGSSHLWTISYEEQFYAVIPWFLRKIFNVGRRTKSLILLSIFIVFSLIRAGMIYANVKHPAIWVLPVTHFESILGGLAVGLGMFDTLLKKISAWILMAAGLVCLLCVSAMPELAQAHWSLMFIYPLIGLGMSLILLSLMTDQQWLLKTVFCNAQLAYFGKISYGLYVYHLLALYAAEKLLLLLGVSSSRLLVYPLSTFAIGLAFTLAASSLSYYLLEKPFLRLKERFSSIQSRPI